MKTISGISTACGVVQSGIDAESVCEGTGTISDVVRTSSFYVDKKLSFVGEKGCGRIVAGTNRKSL
jgi:hypothetical protein